MKRVLITDTGRGLGLGFTEQCLSDGYTRKIFDYNGSVLPW